MTVDNGAWMLLQQQMNDGSHYVNNQDNKGYSGIAGSAGYVGVSGYAASTCTSTTVQPGYNYGVGRNQPIQTRIEDLPELNPKPTSWIKNVWNKVKSIL